MHNFFVEEGARGKDCFFITGNDFKHIKSVLRMQVGEEILVSCAGKSSLCRIAGFGGDTVTAEILNENFGSTELSLKIYLFQGLPKSDKAELIIQKAVELGVYSVIPCEMKRCVVRLEGNKKSSKRARWQSIAESAAKQSKRSIIPNVSEAISLDGALEIAKKLDTVIVPYENARGMSATADALKRVAVSKSVGIFIGPEGGFEESEIEKIKNAGGTSISLGSRILRTETAAITAVSMCMLAAELKEAEKC